MICKRCNECGIEKELSEFQKRKDSKDGLRSKCKNCISEYQKSYQLKYYENNIEKITDYKYNYRRTSSYRDKNNNRLDNKELKIFRSVINNVIKRIKVGKNNLKNIDLVGYSYEDFKNHMEKLFLEGMSWENHGEWHVDHKIPVSKFEILDIKIINSLDNLQPLWAKDNLRKGNRIEPGDYVPL